MTTTWGNNHFVICIFLNNITLVRKRAWLIFNIFPQNYSNRFDGQTCVAQLGSLATYDCLHWNSLKSNKIDNNSSSALQSHMWPVTTMLDNRDDWRFLSPEEVLLDSIGSNCFIQGPRHMYLFTDGRLVAAITIYWCCRPVCGRHYLFLLTAAFLCRG